MIWWALIIYAAVVIISITVLAMRKPQAGCGQLPASRSDIGRAAVVSLLWPLSVAGFVFAAASVACYALVRVAVRSTDHLRTPARPDACDCEATR